MDVDVAVLALVGLAPDGPEEAALRHEPAGVGEEDARGSRTRAASGRRARPSTVTSCAADVQGQRPGVDPAVRVGRRSGRVAEGDPQPGVQLVDAERLRDVVVGAALQGLDLLLLLVASGQDRRSASRRPAGSGRRCRSPSMSGSPRSSRTRSGRRCSQRSQRGRAVGRLLDADSRERPARGRRPGGSPRRPRRRGSSRRSPGRAGSLGRLGASEPRLPAGRGRPPTRRARSVEP